MFARGGIGKELVALGKWFKLDRERDYFFI